MSYRLEDIYQKCLFWDVIDGLPSHDKTRKEFAYLFGRPLMLLLRTRQKPRRWAVQYVQARISRNSLCVLCRAPSGSVLSHGATA
jgi:hypothetical protein